MWWTSPAIQWLAYPTLRSGSLLGDLLGSTRHAAMVPQHMQGQSGVGHPGQAGMTQAVALELFVAEFGDDVILARCAS